MVIINVIASNRFMCLIDLPYEHWQNRMQFMISTSRHKVENHNISIVVQNITWI